MRQTVAGEWLIGVAAVLLTAAAATAHHSFASEFDRDQPFSIEGAVNDVEWTNPHGWLLVDVDEDGDVVTYRIELAAASILMRRGWRRGDVQPGDRLVIDGFRARDRFHVGRATLIARDTGEAIYGQSIDAD